MERKRIYVLMGGPSSEFDVSLKSGEYVCDSLDTDTYEPVGVFVDREGNWDISPEEMRKDAHCAFIAMHGEYGEDGTVQSILRAHNIPHTGASPMESALAMNKFLTLQILSDFGFSIPPTLHIPKGEWNDARDFVLKTSVERIGFPMVIKPNRGGSSIGITIAKTKKEIEAGLDHVFSFTSEALLQELVLGREFTCGVLDHGWGESAFSLLPTEIIHRGDHFSTTGKYDEKTLEITPPQKITEDKIKRLQEVALRAHQRVGASGCSRTDMIMDAKGNIVVLEINTVPGFTRESFIPKAAEASGVPFSKLLDIMIAAGVRAHEGRRKGLHRVRTP
jgi:D-alanine-D-alanine ligase